MNTKYLVLSVQSLKTVKLWIYSGLCARRFLLRAQFVHKVRFLSAVRLILLPLDRAVSSLYAKVAHQPLIVASYLPYRRTMESQRPKESNV